MYAQVIIETKTDSIDNLFTYASDINVKPGDVVKVPFGRGNSLKLAWVVSVSETIEEEIKGIKKIAEKCEDIELNKEMTETALFMKRRYLCRMVDAIECFMPAGSASKRGLERKPLRAINSEELPEAVKPENLNCEQQSALDPIKAAIEAGKHEIFLLNGVTGSGKTEVYIEAIQTALEAGKTAIMLVPEISLTGMMVRRFVSRFGTDNMAVMHSGLSAGERYDEWQRIRKGEAKIVIGARSAVFAPLENIGLIILDEEHETTYKSDKTPKYETVEIAIKRLKAYGGSLILGSATPSVVSYQRAKEGIYTLLEMKERYNKVSLPDVEIVDMREELLAGNTSILSRRLADGIDKSLADGKQVILFLNRRGYSTFISCKACGYVMKCPECEISMTYHKSEDACSCHYCGKKMRIPKLCPECGAHLSYRGTGTEKVEEFIETLYPDAGIARLDLDTAKKKGSMEKILSDFGKGKTKILIGTQIVAKGLDFRNVGLVGIISADVSLNIPDFRSPERTFELITQASGRAGRGDERGHVIIQTYTPENYAVVTASKQDFGEFFHQEIRMRRLLNYPPYCDLLQLVFTSKSEECAKEFSGKYYDMLGRMMEKEDFFNVLRPVPAPIKQEGGKYRYQILIKIPKGKRNSYSSYIAMIKNDMAELKKKSRKIDITMLADFNPYSII